MNVTVHVIAFVCVKLTVADGAYGVVVVHTLTDDSPLGEDRVGAEAIRCKAAAGSHQVVSADVTLTAAYGKVPVGERKCRVLKHVLDTHTHPHTCRALSHIMCHLSDCGKSLLMHWKGSVYLYIVHFAYVFTHTLTEN